MKLNINRQLQSDTTIYLDEKEPLKTYKFTLYRNYKIKKILGKNNKVLEYKRDGDYLEVVNPDNNKLQQIRILYSGYSPVFYSNSQGILLPGYFPYYPMEGYKKIYIKEEGKFVPIIRDYIVNFDISLKSNLDVSSNLNKNDTKFYGKAQEATLIGGFLKEKHIKDNIFYELSLNGIDTSVILNIDSTLNLYKKIFSDNYTFDIKSKKIFQSPQVISCKVIGNGIVSLKDHIFISESDIKGLALGLIQSNLSQDIKKRRISLILFNYLLNKNAFTSNNLSEDAPKEVLEDPLFQIEFLFVKKINELGEDYVVKNSYKFLIDKNDKRDSITFIKNLK
ncbi:MULTISPECIES: hypothetical protein [Clostridium]|nr:MULTISPECIES: hypothetical protein [Clostridium]